MFLFLFYLTMNFCKLLVKTLIRGYIFVTLLMILCLLLFLLFVGVLCLVLVLIITTLYPSSFAIILMGKKELIALLKLFFGSNYNASIKLKKT